MTSSIACGRTEQDKDDNASNKPPSFEPTGTLCPLDVAERTPDESRERACGGECMMETCADGACVAEVMLTDGEGPVTLATDDERLYWGTATGTIKRRAKEGETEVVVEAGRSLRALALFGGRLYWSAADPEGADTTRVESVSLAGDGRSTVDVKRNIEGIGVGEAGAYLADFDLGLVQAQTDGGLLQEPFSWIAGWGNAAGVTVTRDYVFWTQMNLDNSIRYFPSDDPAHPRMLTCYQEWPSAVAAVDGEVFWINRHVYATSGRVMVQALEEDHPRVLTEEREEIAGAIAVDAQDVFWIEGVTNIMRQRR